MRFGEQAVTDAQAVLPGALLCRRGEPLQVQHLQFQDGDAGSRLQSSSQNVLQRERRSA